MTDAYFAIETPDDLREWTTLSALASDATVLSAKVEATSAALGAGTDRRVAASIDFLGMAARVLSPALGWAATDGRAPLLEPDAIWWRPAVPGPMRLAMDVRSWRDASAAALLDDTVRPAIAPVLAAYGTAFALSEQVLWGNVASALSGAAARLGTARAYKLVGDMLSLGELAGTAQSRPPRFVRNSCCLYYRLPGRGLCGDCVLAPAAH
jgi:FhuF 2Fe-2S C-terminal domain